MRIRSSYFAVALFTLIIGISANSLWLRFHLTSESPKPFIESKSCPIVICGGTFSQNLCGFQSQQTLYETISDLPATIPPRPPNSRESEELEPKFNPTGYYSFAGRSPKGLEEIEWIDIDTAEIKPDSYRWAAVPPSGFIRAGGRIYKMSRVLINDRAISFSTESINGNGYHFSGRFLRGGVYYDTLDELPSQVVVLEGRLTKMRNGRKVVERNADFTWFGGD